MNGLQAAQIAVAQHESTVVVTGIKVSGMNIIQDIKIKHKPQENENVIVGLSFAAVARMGGLMVESPESPVEYHPLSSFDKVLFSLKKISLATAGVR